MTESLAALANRHVPFPLAASWAGVPAGEAGERGGGKTWCPFGFLHRDGGTEKSFRVYSDHGFCFAESRKYTVTSLLAAYWGLPYKEAAAEALSRAGYVPVTYAHLWEQAVAAPDPGREYLGRALAEWCVTTFPGWGTLQYDPEVSRLLARCMGLLPLVGSADDCQQWLDRCKDAVRTLLARGFLLLSTRRVTLCASRY
jgi:hypothetical protein